MQPGPGEDLDGWRARLSGAARLETPEEDARFFACCDAVTGQEDPVVIDALVDAVRVADDHGVYEAVHNALWRFPPEVLGARLGALLPAWYRRMRRHPYQVDRFLGPVLGVGEAARPALIAAVRALPAAERAAVARAWGRWAVEQVEAEALVDALRDRPARRPKAPALPEPPAAWPDAWKAWLATLRAGENPMLWQTGSREEMEAVAALLAEPLGAGWRHVEALTNPLYIAFAKALWPEFVARVASFPADARAQVLAQLKQATGRRGAQHDRARILDEAMAAKDAPAPEAPAPVVWEAPAEPDALHPFVGVGPYRFGASRADCVAALGPPDTTRELFAMDQIIDRRGAVSATFQEDRLVELTFHAGATLRAAGVDVFADKGAADALRAAFADHTEQKAYLNLPSVGLVLAGFGKRRTSRADSPSRTPASRR